MPKEDILALAPALDKGKKKAVYVDVDEDSTVEEDPAPPRKDKGKQRQVDDDEANPKVQPLAMQPERKCLIKIVASPVIVLARDVCRLKESVMIRQELGWHATLAQNRRCDVRR